MNIKLYTMSLIVLPLCITATKKNAPIRVLRTEVHQIISGQNQESLLDVMNRLRHDNVRKFIGNDSETSARVKKLEQLIALAQHEARKNELYSMVPAVAIGSCGVLCWGAMGPEASLKFLGFSAGLGLYPYALYYLSNACKSNQLSNAGEHISTQLSKLSRK